MSLALIFVAACDTNNEDFEFVQVAKPILMSKSAFRSSVDISAPKGIEEVGKIYAYKNYIFVGDTNNGIQIIDNSNPSNPKAIKYIKIPGNEDISVKDDILYADSATDLLVFDISDINSIKLEGRLEDVFRVYDYNIPVEAEVVDFDKFDYNNDVIVGWTITTERRKKRDDDILINVDRKSVV